MNNNNIKRGRPKIFTEDAKKEENQINTKQRVVL